MKIGLLTATTALVVAVAGPAAADRREASLHAHVVGGLATTSDPAAGGETASAPLGGLAVRASYATSNIFQYDVSLSLLGTGGASFSTGMFTPTGRPPVSGPFSIPTQLTRLDGGVTVRLGVAWVPTVRLAAGVEGRHRGAPTVSGPGGDVSGETDTGRGGEFGLDLVGTATVGLDHRINRRLIVGAAVGGSLAVPLGGEAFRTLEATMHAAWYWYPR